MYRAYCFALSNYFEWFFNVWSYVINLRDTWYNLRWIRSSRWCKKLLLHRKIKQKKLLAILRSGKCNSESSLSQDKAARSSWHDKSILLINIIMLIIFIITHYGLRQTAARTQHNAHKSLELKSGAPQIVNR